jgi:hypothetical protein
MADQKLTQLTEATSANDGDILYLVTDTGGTPASRKISKTNLLGGYANTGSLYFAGSGIGFVTFKAEANLTGEKVLTAGSSVTIVTDATTLWINAITNAAGGVTYAGTGAMYVMAETNDANMTAAKILIAGSNVTITTAAGAIWINATTGAGGSGATYAATGGYFIMTQTNDANLLNASLLMSGTGASIRTDGGATYVDVTTQNIGGKVGTDTTIVVYYPISGGGSLDTSRLLIIDTAFLVHTGSTIWGGKVGTDTTLVVYYPISGGASLSTSRTISVDTAFLVNTGRTISAGSGLTGGGDLSADRTFSVNTNVRDKVFGAFLKGAIATSTTMEFMRTYIPFNMTPIRMQMALTTTADEPTMVNVNQYPTPIGAAAALLTSAVSIPALAWAGSATTFDTTVLYAGSYLGFSIVRCSTSATVGSNMTITLVSRSS